MDASASQNILKMVNATLVLLDKYVVCVFKCANVTKVYGLIRKSSKVSVTISRASGRSETRAKTRIGTPKAYE